MNLEYREFFLRLANPGIPKTRIKEIKMIWNILCCILLYTIIIIGVMGTIYLLIYLVGGYFYRRYWEKNLKDKPGLEPEVMPILRPLPIKTDQTNKKRPWFLLRFFIWLLSVRKWRLEENWEFKLPKGQTIILHKGFEFDGASVPRPFWAILNPVGLLLIQGLIHDYGYRYQQLWQINNNGDVIAYKKDAGKKVWDDLFKEVGNKVNGTSILGSIAYYCVKLFGNRAWERNRDKEETPDKPVLKGRYQPMPIPQNPSKHKTRRIGVSESGRGKQAVP